MFIRSIISSRFSKRWLILFLFVPSLIVVISPEVMETAAAGQRQVGNGRDKAVTVQVIKYVVFQTPPGGYPDPTEPNPTPQSPVNSDSTGFYPPPSFTVVQQTPYPMERNIEAPIGIPTVGIDATIAPDFDAGLPTELTNPAIENTQVSSGIILWVGFLIGLAIFSAAVLVASHYTPRVRQKKPRSSPL
jgi:hypothetical protein